MGKRRKRRRGFDVLSGIKDSPHTGKKHIPYQEYAKERREPMPSENGLLVNW
jgi:hypothetical protein